MGNSPSQLQKHSIHLAASADEAEREFREKIGVIEIVKNAGTSGDLISSIRDSTVSWETSTTSVGNDFPYDEEGQVKNGAAEATTRGPLANKSSKKPKGNQKSVSNKESSPKYGLSSNQGTPVAVASIANNHSENSSGRASTNVKSISTQQDRKFNQTSSKLSNYSSKSSNDAGTEALLADMQKKFALVDFQQESCLNQIKQMNQDMELYRQDAATKIKEKDDVIAQNEDELSRLRQEVAQMKAERQQKQSSATKEVRMLMRKIADLKKNMVVVEQQRDAALASSRRYEQQPDQNSAATGDNNSHSTSSEVEMMKETMQELLQQLEVSEEEHQKEQNKLHEEVMMLRDKLERLESDFIRVEHERDEALCKLDASKKQLEVEKALNASDLKNYQAELKKWKDRYVQEKTFQKHSTTDMLKKSAVMLGNKLGAGILEGMEDEQTRATYIGDDDEDDDEAEVASALNHFRAMVTHNDVVEVHPIPSDGSSAPVWLPNSEQPSQAFGETISIPNFLSKVW